MARHGLAIAALVSALVSLLFRDWKQFGIELIAAIIISPLWDKE